MKKAILLLVLASNGFAKESTSFVREVLPILSKHGCSSGACHGSPHGKGGFALSLRAFDPEADALTLTRELSGRRVSPHHPDASLLLLKPLMQVSHGGGQRIRKSDPGYEILHQWIREGCKTDVETSPRCEKIVLSPSDVSVLKLPDAKLRIKVMAHFADGSKRDVTHLAVFSVSDDKVATVNRQGVVTGESRGEIAIVVRYLQHIETLPLTFVKDVPGFVWSHPPQYNYVDKLIDEKLQQLQFLPSPSCDDSEFLRRIYLDVIGLLPTVREVRAFLADKDPFKRDKLIDRLLASPNHSRFWALKWGDLLRLSVRQIGRDDLPKYHAWVESSLRNNVRYDQWVRELLLAQGNTQENPAANFYRTEASTEDVVETMALNFLGVRIQCAKCHNHPYERWTQDDYYGLSAFFDRIERKRSKKSLIISVRDRGEVVHPQSKKVMKPWAPGVGTFEVNPKSDRREVFVRWLTRKDNPFLAKVEVNRIWKHLMGRGIVEPIDDFRESNPPSSSKLLHALAKDFVDHSFDRKHILRTILKSRTYQASSTTSKWNREDRQFFSRYQPRRLTAEQLLDAIGQVTALPEQIRNHRPGTKATQLMAPDLANHDFLKIFGQPERQAACQCERTTSTSLPQALELYNGELQQRKLRDRNNRFHRMLAKKAPLSEIVESLYLIALCRRPSIEESTTALEYLKSKKDVSAALEDLCWVVLNLNEFLFQH